MDIDNIQINTPYTSLTPSSSARSIKSLSQTEKGLVPHWHVEQQKEELVEITAILNQLPPLTERKLNFLVHEATNRLVVHIVNSETDEVVREIPPQKVLDVVARIQDAIGLLLDEKI